MTPITLVLPFFANRSMWIEHQKVWSDYPAELRALLHVVLVDDCSPADARPDPECLDGLGSVQMFRCLEKRRWNWLFARNLGVAKAKTEWVLLTDIDHVLPVETFQSLSRYPLDKVNVYRLGRVDAPHPWPYTLAECPVREAKKFHPNTWLMTRKMFDRIGGYDERLSGCYGTDGEFRDRVQNNARAVITMPDARLVRYGREILEDASTPPTTYTRKNDPANDEDLRKRKAERDKIPGWRPLRLTFPYEKVAC